ncbi:MAG: HAMP domain-containing sensor histidine kinase [Ignavibacteria bacterium]
MGSSKYLAFFSCFVLFIGILQAQPVLTSSNNRLYPDFRSLESPFAPGAHVSPHENYAKFTPYAWGRLPGALPEKDRMITLSAGFRLRGIKNDEYLALLSPTMEYPANIYLNGKLISKRGDYQSGYTNRLHRAVSVFLPPDLLYYHPDSINHIAFQLYPKYGETLRPFARPFITGVNEASHDEFWRNLLGPNFAFAVFVFCLISFFYFLQLHLTRRRYDISYYLYFALLNLALSVSQFNNAFSFDYADIMIHEKISKIAYCFVSMYGFIFIMEFSNILKYKDVYRKITYLVFSFPVIILLFQSDLSAILQVFVFVSTCIFIPVNLLNIVVCILFLIKKPGKYSALLFVLRFSTLFFFAHDYHYLTVLGVKPYALLLPYLMFITNIFIFLMLAWEQGEAYQRSVELCSELETLSGSLELKVEERTNQLQETILRLNAEIDAHHSAQRELKAVNATKDKLFSIIAHDLRSPFNSLIGIGEVITEMLDEGDIEQSKDMMTHIKSTARNAYDLLQNLLEWANVQRGAYNFRPEKLSVSSDMEESFGLLMQAAWLKEIELETDITRGLYVKADKNMYNAILRNLINNAIKFTPKGGTITFSAGYNKDFMEIKVSDTGVGMSQEVMDNLFRKDVNVTTPGTENEKGTGLGLILCKELVEIQGGKIEVSSRTGNGSVFSFTLPVYPVA